jgi:tetratricopeptide (TPR) repeat protein
MTPLFYAVYHGCRGGLHAEILDNVYFDRLLRGEECFLTKKLGALSTDLSLLANFFRQPWSKPADELSPDGQAWVLGTAGSHLRTVGRLTDAIDPSLGSAERYRNRQNWSNVSECYNIICEVQTALGGLREAIGAGTQAVSFADRTDNGPHRSGVRTALAAALHLAGQDAKAAQLYEEAESIQRIPGQPWLYSGASFRYCEFLLSQGKRDDVRRRAGRALEIARGVKVLLDIGVSHLSLGLTYPSGSDDAKHHLDRAVDFIRQSGQIDDLPRALLARATPADLDEACRIATRSGMRLYLADYHLISSRFALANGDRVTASEHYTKAAQLIRETGYHRRDQELSQLHRMLE